MRDLLDGFPGALAASGTAWLAAGLAAAWLLRRRPARAHSVLALAAAGALVTPLLVVVVQRAGWGVLPAAAATAAPRPPLAAAAAPPPPPIRGCIRGRPGRAGGRGGPPPRPPYLRLHPVLPPDAVPDAGAPARHVGTAAVPIPIPTSAPRPSTTATPTWRAAILGGWLALSAAFALR